MSFAFVSLKGAPSQDFGSERLALSPENVSPSFPSQEACLNLGAHIPVWLRSVASCSVAAHRF